MLLSNRITGAMGRLAVLLLCAAAAISGGEAGAVRVDTFSYPVFDANTTQGLVGASNEGILVPASLLFDHDGAFAEFNRTEGFLLLPVNVDVWRSGAGGAPAVETSFNTSFTLTGSAPVAFVLLRDTFPTLHGDGGLRGFANYTSSDDGVRSATAVGLASVEAGPVRSYGPDDPAVGLNVTVTPNGTAASRSWTTVWIEYDAAGHRLHVYVASAGKPRPAKALIDAPLDLAGERTTETASVGFFAASIQDMLVGVRDWDLAVDSLEGGGKKKGTAWWAILLAVLGSVAATATVVTAVVCCLQSRRRRRERNMQPPKM